MKDSPFKIQLKKIIGQIKFRPTLGSYSKIPDVLSRLESDFDEWRAANAANEITLYSPSDAKFFTGKSDSLTYTHEKAYSSEESSNAVTLLSKVFQDYPINFEIKEIRRVGFRTMSYFGFKGAEYDDLVDLVFRSFYGNKDRLLDISSDEKRDTVFILEGKKDGLFNRVQIGPVRKDEVIRIFNNSFPVDGEDLSEQGLFFDVDVYLGEGLTQETITESLQGISTASAEITDKYLDFLTE